MTDQQHSLQIKCLISYRIYLHNDSADSLPVAVQLLSDVRLFGTLWTVAQQASLSFALSWSLLKLMSIESVMPSNRPVSPLPPALNLSCVKWWWYPLVRQGMWLSSLCRKLFCDVYTKSIKLLFSTINLENKIYVDNQKQDGPFWCIILCISTQVETSVAITTAKRQATAPLWSNPPPPALGPGKL